MLNILRSLAPLSSIMIDVTSYHTPVSCTLTEPSLAEGTGRKLLPLARFPRRYALIEAGRLAARDGEGLPVITRVVLG
jgi:hypothetical protein